MTCLGLAIRAGAARGTIPNLICVSGCAEFRIGRLLLTRIWLWIFKEISICLHYGLFDIG
jgi:hypothetical protein